jgi:dolichyl-phosphate beta-glucosyltransferase
VCLPIIESACIKGFAFDVELLFLAQRAGLRLREIPVRWNHVEGSKVHFLHDSLAMLREVIALRMRS